MNKYGVDMRKVIDSVQARGKTDVDEKTKRTTIFTLSGKQVVSDDSLDGKKKKSVSEMSDSELRKISGEHLKEYLDDGGIVYLYTNRGMIVETNSKSCGEDECVFLHDGIGYIRLWIGSDNMNSLLFDYPDVVIPFSIDDDGVVAEPILVTTVQQLDLKVLNRIYNRFLKSVSGGRGKDDGGDGSDGLSSQKREPLTRDEVKTALEGMTPSERQDILDSMPDKDKPFVQSIIDELEQ